VAVTVAAEEVVIELPPVELLGRIRDRRLGECRPHLFAWNGAWWMRYQLPLVGRYPPRYITAVDLVPVQDRQRVPWLDRMLTL
jgi:hypothetical protein